MSEPMDETVVDEKVDANAYEIVEDAVEEYLRRTRKK